MGARRAFSSEGNPLGRTICVQDIRQLAADDGISGGAGNLPRFHIGDFLSSIVQAAGGKRNPCGPQGQAAAIDGGSPELGAGQACQFLAQLDGQRAVLTAGLDPDILIAEFGRIGPAFDLEIIGGSIFSRFRSPELPGNDIGPGNCIRIAVNLYLGIVPAKRQTVRQGSQMVGMAFLIRIFQTGHPGFAFAVRIVKSTARDRGPSIRSDDC